MIESANSKTARSTKIDAKSKMDAIDEELSKIVGYDELKLDLKAMISDERPRSLGLESGATGSPHMVFSGNPGTGKTTIVRTLGKVLHMMGALRSEKVVEVRRADLVAGQKALGAKIKEAEGGILLVDDTCNCLPIGEEIEAIKPVMDKGRVLVILAGYNARVERLLSSNGGGLRRRFRKIFHVDDFTCEELAKILRVKMSDEESPWYGYRLHASCTEEVVARMIERETTQKQRKVMNGGLVDVMLENAVLNLDSRVGVECRDEDSLMTITSEDLAGALWEIKDEVGRILNIM